MTRKERRYLAAERKARGLPPARPWQHRKVERFAALDRALADKHAIPLEVVRDIIGSTVRVLTNGSSKTAAHCDTVEG
jgi:hypothetical protein